MSFWPTHEHWSVKIPLAHRHRRLPRARRDRVRGCWPTPASRCPQSECGALEYMDWKSGGDTNFAPLASADGELDCRGFWDKGKTDKDALWTSNAELVADAARLRRRRRRQLRPGAGDQARAAVPRARRSARSTATTTTASTPRTRAGWCAPGWS